MVQDNNDNEAIVLEPPRPIYSVQSCYSNNPSSATLTSARQLSMSSKSLEMHPRISTKDASYSFIWIDDPYRQLSTEKSTSKEEEKGHHCISISPRGICNLITIILIIGIIVFLFIYPFTITFK